MLDPWNICNQFSGLWCPWVSFGMLCASTLASWRTLGRSWDDPGTILGHWRAQGRALGRPGLDFIGLLLILGTHSDSFLGTFGLKKKFFSYLFPGCFVCWFLDLNFGVGDRKNMHLAWKVLQKSAFAETGFLMISGSIFHDFG